VNLIDFKRNEIEITVNEKNETIVKNIIAKNSSSDIIKNETHSSNNQLPDSDSNKWKEDIRTALKNQKVNFIANSSKKKCYWCSNNVNCVKKTDAQMKDEIIRSKWSTQFLLMGILSGDDREEKSKNPMVLSFINSPIEIELYDCPKFCSRKCEYESYRAGY
jgi:transcription elongation factor GreA-like protein